MGRIGWILRAGQQAVKRFQRSVCIWNAASDAEPSHRFPRGVRLVRRAEYEAVYRGGLLPRGVNLSDGEQR
jgi:hypothetical protein